MKAVQKKRPELSVLGGTPATAVISQCCSYHALVWRPAPFALTGKGLVSAVPISCTKSK